LRIDIRTGEREQFIDVTERVRQAVKELGLEDGAVLVFCRHTTAGVTINENADPDVTTDLGEGLRRIVPRRAGWRHTEGNSDAHLKSSLVGHSVVIPVERGDVNLGTWQAVYFCEFDGPRSRHFVVSALAAAPSRE
jgi:secondary thiamine-phosphate synthase enzyme